jgi:Spy/CpxP family protein refolding chaperone
MKRLLVGLGMLAVVISFFFTAGPVQAQDNDVYDKPRQKRVEQKQEKLDRMIEMLGLSNEQVEELKAHRQARKESNEKLHLALREQKEELRDELDKPESDNARIKKIADSIKKIQSEMVDERIKGILEIKAILTPEQYAKFKEKVGHYKDRNKHKIKKY